MTWRVLEGDCRAVMATLPAESVQTCVTSPPYWGLRDYGHEGQLGLEATPEEYVARMVEVFREVRRVLRPDGTLWLNLGDCYAGSRCGEQGVTGQMADRAVAKQRKRVTASGLEGAGRNQAHALRADEAGRGARGTLKPKDLVGIPWRVAFALQADGWWLRSDIVWAKPNPMPESITDRPTKAHEYLFLFAKSERYFYDADAIREPDCGRSSGNGFDRPERLSVAAGSPEEWTPGGGRNKRDVWTVSCKPFSGAHFAVMPWDLVEPCVLAGTSAEGACACGAPRERVVEVTPMVFRHSEREGDKKDQGLSTALHGTLVEPAKRKTVGWRPTCACDTQARGSQTVLDPFAGSGTVGMVARRHGRSFVGCELNPEYAAMARERITGDAPLFNATTEAA